MIFKKLFKKFKENKGVTGTDVAAAITVIVFTMGIVTAIYINVTNKVKENIRYSNATRIATQIVENVQSKPYDYLLYYLNGNLSKTSTSSEKFYDVNVPNGYTATITTSKVSDTNAIDIVRDVEVSVSYKISNKTNTITLYTTKEKELLEQTNKPDVSYIELTNEQKCYPVRKSGTSYYVTDIDDPNWYNYDSLLPAYVYVTSENLNLNADVTSGSGTFYAWIPRFGLNDENIAYCYGASSYKILLNCWINDSKTLWAYSLKCTNGVVDALPKDSDGNYTYASDTFTENDGLSGVWYNLTNTSNQLSVYTDKGINVSNIKTIFDSKGFAISK